MIGEGVFINNSGAPVNLAWRLFFAGPTNLINVADMSASAIASGSAPRTFGFEGRITRAGASLAQASLHVWLATIARAVSDRWESLGIHKGVQI